MPPQKYRMGYLLDLYRAGLLFWSLFTWALQSAKTRLLSQEPAVPVGVRLRQLIEKLGISYVKLGQYLALRTDLLPPAICAELDRLFDSARPLAFAEVQAQVTNELGGPLEQFFSSFEQEPIGSASVAQVHKAVALDGEILAVKVQRPGVEVVFASDMRNLRKLAKLVDYLGFLGQLSALQVVDEFAEFTAREFDFIGEAETAESLGRDMVANVEVPHIRWDLTTTRLMTMEFIEGISLLHVCQLYADGRWNEVDRILRTADIEEVVDNITEVCLHQLFVTGRFHGDPHYGNILIRPNGVAVFIDWGIHGELSEDSRESLAGYCEALATGNVRVAARLWMRLSVPTAATDLMQYENQLTGVLAGWYETSQSPDATAQERHVARWQGEIVKVMRQNSVRARKDQLLVWRAITILEASALMLPFRFELLDKLSNFFRRYKVALLKKLVFSFSSYENALPTVESVREALGTTRRTINSLQDPPRLRIERQSRRVQRQVLQQTAALLMTVTGLCLAALAANVPLRTSFRGGLLIGSGLFLAVGIARSAGVHYPWRR